jgi:3-hydroxyisobutyrate dehydrogenase-like beta-hydroxyacid dehydrogenase
VCLAELEQTQRMNGPPRLVVFGLGYTGAAIAARAAAAGWQVAGTSRDPAGIRVPAGVQVVAFDRIAGVLVQATHLVATAPPD